MGSIHLADVVVSVPDHGVPLLPPGGQHPQVGGHELLVLRVVEVLGPQEPVLVPLVKLGPHVHTHRITSDNVVIVSLLCEVHLSLESCDRDEYFCLLEEYFLFVTKYICDRCSRGSFCPPLVTTDTGSAAAECAGNQDIRILGCGVQLS